MTDSHDEQEPRMTDSRDEREPINRLILGSELLAEDPSILERLAPLPPEEADAIVRAFLAGEEYEPPSSP